MSHGGGWGSYMGEQRAHREAEREGGTVAKCLYCGFCGKAGTRQGEQA